MPIEVSATGVSVRIIASRTFPQGFTVTQFADDADPFDVPDVTVSANTMNVNGDLVSASAPAPILFNLAVLPNTEDDQNLNQLLNANRAARGRRHSQDVITLVVTWPSGATDSYIGGKIQAGNPGRSAASAGRIKSKTYGFAFEDMSATPAR